MHQKKTNSVVSILGESEAVQLRRRIGLLEREIRQLSLALDRERRQSRIDPLTGIPNRRAYQDRLREYRARSEREAQGLSLLVLDIDHFKSINDRYGHRIGDRVLACVAQKISRRLRKSDFVARFGGEEFVALLPGCNADSAQALAEQLCRDVAACDIETDRGVAQVTLSCGVAELDPVESDSACFNRADSALYRAKDEGRNRVCIAEQAV